MQIERFKELLDEDELRYQIQRLVGSQFGVFISSSESSLLEDTILLEITLTYEAFDRNSYMREEVFDSVNTHRFTSLKKTMLVEKSRSRKS